MITITVEKGIIRSKSNIVNVTHTLSILNPFLKIRYFVSAFRYPLPPHEYQLPLEELLLPSYYDWL